MIVVTGAAGFIGSCLAGKLNELGFDDLVLVDDFSINRKNRNWQTKNHSYKVERDVFHDWLQTNQRDVDFVFHMGARTDTTESDTTVFKVLNLDYSKEVWRTCGEYNIPLVYASSAATYGSGELGYDDSHAIINQLHPLNPYGESKNEFDKWVIVQPQSPPFWAGLKFFNVYGPNEYHKGRMASAVYHAFNQVQETGLVKLFRSHNPEYEDGKQVRDFIYVKDAVDICHWLMEHRPTTGIYNVGTGTSRTFIDLATSVFTAMEKELNIEFIDTPEDIREKYQYFTEANMSKLRSVGYDRQLTALGDGIDDYARNYLLKDASY